MIKGKDWQLITLACSDEEHNTLIKMGTVQAI